MRFLLDENFPKTAGIRLIEMGHEVFDFRGTTDEGIDDLALFRKAQQLKAILLTTDRDFFHTIPHLFESHQGVVVIALRQPSRAAIISRMEWLLSHLKSDHFLNRAFQFRDKTWIAYPPIAEG